MNLTNRTKMLDTRYGMEEFLKRSVKFWLEKGVDRECGGYLVCFDESGELSKSLEVLLPTDKLIVTQTRMIWGFSAMLRSGMAAHYGIEERCREAAAQGVEFFINHFWDEKNGGFVWCTDRAGTVTDDGKLTYGQTFAIYALAEYAMATGDSKGLLYAEKTFDCMMKYCIDSARGGYYENMTGDWTRETERDHGGDLKSLDIHMHVMEAYTTLYECSGKEIHKRRLKESIDIILNRMIDYQYGCGCNQFDYEFRPKPARDICHTWNYDRDAKNANKNPQDTTSYGHNIELVWLLNRAYEVMGEPPAVAFTQLITTYCIKNGWDRRYGGFYRDGLHDGRVIVTDKEWWQNYEALTGLLDSYVVTGEEEFLEKFFELWEFDSRYFYNEISGESRQLLTAAGKPIISDIGNQWKCIYHTDRAMIECISRIDGILAESKGNKAK